MAALPSRQKLFDAAVELVSRDATALKGTARRYSICAADAEDAYQRGLEILMTKAPTTRREELRPWLHTVIKHEALAVRRHRERAMAAEPLERDGEQGAGPDEAAGARERARRAAEALGGLKPSELQCLLLKSLGYTYDEIAARTGFSWTKVNRSLTEGRRRFFDGFARIESGALCEEFAPLLSAACDGEASPDEERRVRAHLVGCHSCRAALREYRAAPGRLAELLPPVVFGPAIVKAGALSRLCDSLVASGADRASAAAHKLSHFGEAAAAQKTAAVVASTAALAGGVAVERQGAIERDRHVPAVAREKAAEASDRSPAAPMPTTPSAAPVAPAPQPPPPPPSAAPARTGTPQPTGEFTPEVAAGTASGSQDAVDASGATASAGAGGEFRAGSAGSGAAAAASQGEFGP